MRQLRSNLHPLFRFFSWKQPVDTCHIENPLAYLCIFMWNILIPKCLGPPWPWNLLLYGILKSFYVSFFQKFCEGDKETIPHCLGLLSRKGREWGSSTTTLERFSLLDVATLCRPSLNMLIIATNSRKTEATGQMFMTLKPGSGAKWRGQWIIVEYLHCWEYSKNNSLLSVFVSHRAVS